MKAAIYARVSTEGKKNADGTRLKGQTVEPQLLELRDHCARNNWEVAGEWTDVMSGTRAARPGLDALIAAAKTGAFEAIVVVKMDRLGRSVLNVVRFVEDMDKMGVAIICTSQGIDTRKDSPCGRMIMQIMAAFAEFERSLISERTIAGLAAVKASGKILGKPSKTLVPNHAEVIAEWKATPNSGGYRVLAQKLGGVSPMTARKLAMAGK